LSGWNRGSSPRGRMGSPRALAPLAAEGKPGTPRQCPRAPRRFSTCRADSVAPRRDFSAPRTDRSSPRFELPTPRAGLAAPQGNLHLPRARSSEPRSGGPSPRRPTRAPLRALWRDAGGTVVSAPPCFRRRSPSRPIRTGTDAGSLATTRSPRPGFHVGARCAADAAYFAAVHAYFSRGAADRN
jgi:hypothetical protein